MSERPFRYALTRWCLIAALVGAFACGTIASSQSRTADIPAVVSMAVRGPLQPVVAHGKFVVGYELDIFNRTGADLPISSLEIFAADGPILRYAKSELEHNGRQFTPQADNLHLPLKAGGRAVIFCWFETPSNGQPPKQLRHRLTYRTGPSTSQTVELVSSVLDPATLSLGAPAEAGEWLAASGPSNESEHRRAQIRIDGNPDAPFSQRYAIDWVRVCDGKLWQSKGKDNTDYCGYGSNAIAVADATVAAVRDDIPENQPGGSSRSARVSKDTILGNYVVLDLGAQRFAVYAHLQPNSVQVKTGATVRRGQIVARIGNSGISDAPHLHFHVGQAMLPADVVTGQTTPIPYVLEKFEWRGKYTGKGRVPDTAREARSSEIPLDQDVVTFQPRTF